jgi:imidazolonepropionase
MPVDLLVHNIAQLVTLAGSAGSRRGRAMRELGIIERGAVAIAGGRVVAIGPEVQLIAAVQPVETLDAGGRAVIPGFVDPHTHLPWAGHRAHEFELRIGGATYMEIMAAGGGIVRTVTDTRAASLDHLVSETADRVKRMLIHGTTTAEAKTGYGLNVPDELKQLESIACLQRRGPLDLVPTFLGAHAVPAEYRGRTDAYVDLVVEETLPAAWGKWQEIRGTFPAGWPIFCDVFCEQGAFDLARSRRILEAAKQLGFRLKMHVDEFAPLGGTPLGVDLGATSVDHIVTTLPEHVALLARSDTIGVALPGTPFGLGHHDYSPARALIDEGGALALATDLNPGTSWCESMQMMLALACRYMKLLPAEALVAATLNAAHAIGLGHLVGSLEAGKQADLLVLDVDDYRMLPYRYGTNMVRQVIKRGCLLP